MSTPMNKNYFIVLFILSGIVFFSGKAEAQSLKDILNSPQAKEAAAAVASKGKLTESELAGNWIYLHSACELKSENMLKEVSGNLINSQIEKKVDDICSQAGIKEGTLTFIFNNDKSFTTTLLNNKSLTGTYSFDKEAQRLTLNFAAIKKIPAASLNANVSKSNKNITLLFNADKLLKLISIISSTTDNAGLKAVNSLASQYDGVMLGFEMKK